MCPIASPSFLGKIVTFPKIVSDNDGWRIAVHADEGIETNASNDRQGDAIVQDRRYRALLR